jgi:hypothetical protein
MLALILTLKCKRIKLATEISDVIGMSKAKKNSRLYKTIRNDFKDNEIAISQIKTL